MAENITRAIKDQINRKGRGWTFSPKDLSKYGPSEAVYVALHRLEKQGKIRRVARGVYDLPRYNNLLKSNLGPDIDQVAHALARKFGWRIIPNGNVILNITGVSTQVPARYEYLSDGPYRKYHIEGTEISFRKVASKEASFRYPDSALIVQGLRALGPKAIDDRAIEKMRAWLPEGMRRKVLDDTRNVTKWIYDAIRKICREEQNVAP